MKRDYIDFRLFPNIEFNGNIYSNYDDYSCRMLADSNIPFLRAYNDAHNDLKLLLIGNGSLGKSTSLRVFEAEMLIQKIPCLFYECKNINANDIALIDTIVKHHRNEIFIFDAYDELQESVRELFNDLIEKLNQHEIRVIVSSRFDPRSVYGSEATNEIFSSYQSMNICDFTDNQLDSLVSKAISRNSGYYGLLKNTMFLSLHLELERNNLIGSLRESIKTEADFIQQYFELLYLDKLSDEVQLSDLLNLGEYIHNQRTTPKNNRHEIRIPKPLRHIFRYGSRGKDEKNKYKTRVLMADQVKYLNYLHGLYLKDCLLSMVDDLDRDALIHDASELLNIASTSEISESAYYAGQLLADCPDTVDILKAYNSPESKESTHYENVLCLFLGYNNDVAEDLPGVFEFYSPLMENDPYSYIYVCDRIRVLKANSIVNIKFAYCGLPQLEQISITNAIFVSQDNCLIKGKTHELYLGCVNGYVPDGVKYVHPHAFTRCPIEKLVLPDSTLIVDQYAFSYCEKLTYVELGESVMTLNKYAFYKCSSIKTIHIKNSHMQIGRESYDIRAFVRVPKLEEAIVPTSGVSYMYKIAAETLASLEVFQGYSYGKPERFSFDCIKPPARLKTLKKLTLRKDIEEISEEAFIQLANNLESIVVEEGCENYFSVDNCLISRYDETLMLGCKNSIIPTSGVKRIKSYAFARCTGLLEIEIPENISHISYNCFQECFHLQTVIFKCKELRLEDRAFIACRNLKTVICSDIESWVNYKYADDVTSNPLCYARELQCMGLTDGTLVIPEGTPEIEKGAFRRCCSIKKIFIPRSIQTIGGCAFNECDNIEEVHIESLSSWSRTVFGSFSANPLSQGARLFISGTEAKDLVFDKNSTIYKHALIRTQSIESIVLHDGCEVGYEAFKECPNLTKVTIKSPNVKINSSAFRGCAIDISFTGSEPEWQAIANGELEGVASISFSK